MTKSEQPVMAVTHCQNHPARRARFVAAFKWWSPPYEREVPLCRRCAGRTKANGVLVRSISDVSND